MVETTAHFDTERARLDTADKFAPFYPEAYESLREVVSTGIVRAETPVLLRQLNSGVITLLTQQMAYHHVAQGELTGEPWMVSF